jgi:hypothetical protein
MPTSYDLVETFNINLCTGEEFGLEEVFADNVDYVDLISVQARITLENEGIDVDQELFQRSLDDYFENPMFVFHNSDFVTNGFKYSDSSGEREVYILLHLDENFAITERFYQHGRSIYSEGQEGERVLLTYVSELNEWEKQYSDDGVEINLSGYYGSNFPEQIRFAIELDDTANENLLGEMKRILINSSEPSLFASYDKTVTTSKVQDFINVRTYENALIYSENTSTSYMDIHHQTLKCYRDGVGEPLRISQIFAAGVDAGKILESLVSGKLEAAYVATHAAGAEEKIVGFCMNHESLFAEYLGDPALPSYVIELKYADIGYGNLNIFN